MNSIVCVSIVTSSVHVICQSWEDYLFPKGLKYKGDIANRTTSIIFNSCLVACSLYNLVKSFYENTSYQLDTYTRTSQYCMVGFFIYDFIFMILSESRRYYTMYILHHVCSIILIAFINFYNCGNNLIDNLMIVLLEFPTLFINTHKIHTYVYPESPRTKTLQHITSTVYYVARIRLYEGWLLLSPFTWEDITVSRIVAYMCFTVLYFMNMLWYKKMETPLHTPP
jgi:hypothetical protein